MVISQSVCTLSRQDEWEIDHAKDPRGYDTRRTFDVADLEKAIATQIERTLQTGVYDILSTAVNIEHESGRWVTHIGWLFRAQ